MTQGASGVDNIDIFSAGFPALDIICGFKLANNFVNRPLGKSDRLRNLTNGAMRVFGDVSQHQSVISNYCPTHKLLE